MVEKEVNSRIRATFVFVLMETFGKLDLSFKMTISFHLIERVRGKFIKKGKFPGIFPELHVEHRSYRFSLEYIFFHYKGNTFT